MDKPVKTAKGLLLPLVPNQPVKLFLQNGSNAQTFPESIDKIEYNNGMLYISFITGSSYYDKIPLRIQILDNYTDGQIIAKGCSVNTQGSPVLVESIEQILDDKIIIRDSNGNTFATPIFPQ